MIGSVMGSGLTPARAAAIATAGAYLDIDALRESAAGVLPAPMAFARSQAADASATALAADGVTVNYFAADVPRFNGVSRRLLQGVQSTNLHTNPLGVGGTPGVIGSGGVAPTAWGVPSITAGVTVEYIGNGVTDGVAWTEWHCYGTTTANWQALWVLQQSTAIAAAVGQTFAVSLWAQLVAGSWPTGVASLGLAEHDGGTFLGARMGASFLPTLGQWLRRQEVLTVVPAATNNVRPRFSNNFLLPPGTDVNFRIRIGGLDTKLGSFVSSPVLPVAGGSGPVARGDDVFTVPLASLGLPPSRACTFLYRGLIEGLTGAPQTIYGMDDDSNNNRYSLRVSATGIPQIVRARGGAEVVVDIGTVPVTPGTLFTCGMTVAGAGNASAAFHGFNGNVPASVTGGPTAGLVTGRVGRNFGGTFTMAGEHDDWRWVAAVPGSVLPSVVAAYAGA